MTSGGIIQDHLSKPIKSMTFPMWILVVLILIETGYIWAKDGQPKDGSYRVGSHLFAVIVV